VRISALNSIRERLLSEIAEGADEIEEHLDYVQHTAPFGRARFDASTLLLDLRTGPKVVTDISANLGRPNALDVPEPERRCAPDCR
jgi:hypothetical protein